jgi:hypothetical protein
MTTRRLAAILAADLAGFSAMMEHATRRARSYGHRLRDPQDGHGPVPLPIPLVARTEKG